MDPLCEFCLVGRPKKPHNRFCSRSCSNKALGKLTAGIIKAPAIERFWAKVERTETCWYWRGSMLPEGYGHFGVTRSITILAHRFSFVTAYGPVPDEVEVHHECQNRNCVRPDHLEALTSKQHAAHHPRPRGFRSVRSRNFQRLMKKMTPSNALAIPPEVQAELVTEADRTKGAMALLQNFQITCHDHLEFAGTLVQDVKARWADLELKRTSITQPINEALRAVNALFSPVQGPLKQAEAILKSKIGAYTLQQQQLQEQAMRAAAAAIQAGQPQQAAAHVAAVAPAAPVQGISVKPRWAYEIIDEAAVPRQFCSPDHTKISSALPREVHPNLTPQIAGLRIFVEGAVTARKGR